MDVLDETKPFFWNEAIVSSQIRTTLLGHFGVIFCMLNEWDMKH